MKILFYTDCMAIDAAVEEPLRYPALLKQHFPDTEIQIVDLDGMTTREALDNLETAIGAKPDIAIYAFGINDALPRGLHRERRGKLIRAMYKMKMSKGMRLAARTWFLNPLEFLLQILAKPKHYFTIEQTLANIDACMVPFQENGIRTALVNINPILNYRFINANRHIQRYNEAITAYCAHNGIPCVDAFSRFMEIGLDRALAPDRFHYSAASHKAVADDLIQIIQKMKE